jgi:protein SCO1/2
MRYFFVIFVSLNLFLSSTYVRSQGLNSSSKVSELEGVSIEQNLGTRIPLVLPFFDETGREVALAEYFDDKPVVLVPVYYECPMLCTMVLNGVLKSIRALSFDAGNEYDIVTFSFDPRETHELAKRKKDLYLNKYGREGAEEGWHFLTADSASIARLARAIGFNYRYDEESNQYVHASGIMVLTPDGVISRYFYGIEYSARDLKFGLLEASESRIGSPVDQLLLYCFHYDPTTGKYGVIVMNVVRLAGTTTAVLVIGFIVLMLIRDRKKKSLKVENGHLTTGKV